MELLGRVVNVVWSLAASILGSAVGLGFLVPSAVATFKSLSEFDLRAPVVVVTTVRPLDGLATFADMFHWQWLQEVIHEAITYQNSLGPQASDVLLAIAAIVLFISFGLVVARRRARTWEAIWAESAAWIGFGTLVQLGGKDAWPFILAILGALLILTLISKVVAGRTPAPLLEAWAIVGLMALALVGWFIIIILRLNGFSLSR